MTDNNSNRTVEDIIAAAIDRHDSQDAPRTITPDQLRAMAADRQRQKRRRYLRSAGFAAVFVLAVISAAVIFNSFTADVGADKNRKEEIRTEDGVVIEDGGYGGSSEDKVVITEWEDIDVIKLTNEKMLVPHYLPGEYIFERLTIEKIDTGDTTYEYIFISENDDNIIELEQYVQCSGETYSGVDNSIREISCNKGKINIVDENKGAIIQTNDGMNIKVWCTLSDKEIVKIIEGLKY